jgi:23S rRNA (cytidine1920-2'-O)/16S rRNA (cytidine1409-2'-O)-methyltransferase
LIVAKTRLDELMVRRGLADSVAKAAAVIMTGDVLVADRPVTKPGTAVHVDATIRLRSEPMPYVSRGGLKLAGAFGAFSIPITGRICLDVGISTGGFTDYLLQHGAKKVIGVDVGYGQVDMKLQRRPDVVILERTHVRHLTREQLGEEIDLVVMDLSFISVKKVLPHLKQLLRPGTPLVVLVKPQFEAAPDQIDEGGIVRDEAVRHAILFAVKTEAQSQGFVVMGDVLSPITGTKGNQEVFLWLRS